MAKIMSHNSIFYKLCKITIWTCLQSVGRCPQLSRNVWPKNVQCWLVTQLPLNTADFAPLKAAQWKRLVPRSLDSKVIYPIEFVCSRPFEWYKNHQNRTSETYLKMIQFCLNALVQIQYLWFIIYMIFWIFFLWFQCEALFNSCTI